MKSDESIILEAVGITKSFPGVKALDDINFDLRKGEIHALVGENGAGKSTFINILGGIEVPDSGDVIIEKKSVKFKSSLDAHTEGIAVVCQELSLVQNLNIAENIFANRQPVRQTGLIKWNQLYRDTKDLLALFGEDDLDPKTLLKHLPMAKQQMVEILKAMSFDPRIIILDEPTSSLTNNEVEKLFANLEKLKCRGISILYISHNMGEVFRISDRITVFRDGKYITTKRTNDTTEKEIVTLMVGRELVNIYGERRPDELIGEEYFKITDFTRGTKFRNINFGVNKGEIVGLFGLIGAGRTELALAIFGSEPPDSGSITLSGRELKVNSESASIKNGIAYMTEDRKNYGLILDSDVKSNLVMPSLKNFVSRFLDFLDEKKILRYANNAKEQFNIVTPSVFKKLRNLSGGNQQKVLLAIWCGIKPELLIVDEPTRGVDVGAKSEIYGILRKIAADNGIGILLISSDLPEVLGLSDRILVMKDGDLVGEFSRDEATEEKIILYATGVA